MPTLTYYLPSNVPRSYDEIGSYCGPLYTSIWNNETNSPVSEPNDPAYGPIKSFSNYTENGITKTDLTIQSDDPSIGGENLGTSILTSKNFIVSVVTFNNGGINGYNLARGYVNINFTIIDECWKTVITTFDGEPLQDLKTTLKV